MVVAIVALALSVLPVSASSIVETAGPAQTVAAGHVVYGALAVETGASHTCAIRSDATLACWGDDTFGQASAPTGTYKAVSAGDSHTCAIRTNDTLACWGIPIAEVVTPPAGDFSAVSAGGQHTCAIKTDGTLACWGANNAGQASPPAGSFSAVSAGYYHTCAIRSDGTIACWGDATAGQSTPPAGTFIAVSAGSSHTCAIATAGTVACWGNDLAGQATPPVGVFKAVGAGSRHTCAIKTDGAVACWGAGLDGLTKPPADTYTTVSAAGDHACALTIDGWLQCWGYSPGPIPPGFVPITNVSAGWYHTCILDQPEGDARCWGDNDVGQATVPAGKYLAISAGQSFTCAIKSDDTLGCWGANDFGQAQPPSGAFSVVSAGGNHACAVHTNGALACWGYNAYGQSTAPSGTFIDVSAGFRHTCAIRTDGTAVCWGSDEYGQASPPSGSYSQVTAGLWHTCAIRSDGAPICWGENGDGQASPPDQRFTRISAGLYHTCGVIGGLVLCWGYGGDGQTSVPVAGFTDVSAGAWHSCGIKTDRTPICWGSNYYNQSTPAEPAATTYVPITPTRLLDSRVGNGLSGRFRANTARTFHVAGRGPVPANAVAVTGILAVTRQTAAGYASVTPVATNSPLTSSLNFPVGDTRANNVTVALGPGGTLGAVYHAPTARTADLILDVTGYFLADETGATYKPASPVRLLDTRVANGLTGTFAAGAPRTWQITGRGTIPAGATAITGNLAVVGSTGAGYVAVGPTPTSKPTTSTMNFPKGDTRANGLTVKLATNGTLSAVYMAPAGTATQLILDVTGYYVGDLSGARFYPLVPDRVLDSRYDVGLQGAFSANTAESLTVAARVGVPADAVGFTGNLAVVDQTKAGYVAMTQVTTDTPSTSTINFPLGDTRANGVTGPLSGSGTVGLVYRASTGATAHLVLDVTGYFRSPTSGSSSRLPLKLQVSRSEPSRTAVERATEGPPSSHRHSQVR